MTDRMFTVVVGVSPTSKSPAALRWAQALAEQNAGRVVAVRSFRQPPPAATPSGQSLGRMQRTTESQVAAQLQADVAAVLGPEHEVECRAILGGTRKVLLHASQSADLLVVDAPQALAVGPVLAHRLVYAASCPVVVMPPAISEEGEPLRRRAARSAGRRLLAAAGTAGTTGFRLP